MAEATTLARPYAQAVFELAKDTGKLGQWSDSLSTLSAIAAEDQVKGLIANPNVDSEQLAELLVTIAKDKLDQESQNFVKVLAENGRLTVITEISESFEALKAEAEKTVKAEVISAFKVGAEQKKKLEDALQKRLGCDVEVSTTVDKSIVGGVIVRAGDLIIDGSVTGQLDRLASELSH
jgi:F-type H+-transporting ATPase subunit delta